MGKAEVTIGGEGVLEMEKLMLKMEFASRLLVAGSLFALKTAERQQQQLQGRKESSQGE